MNITLITFAPFVAFAVLSLVFLAFRLHIEAVRHTEELQFFLRYRICSHNKVKAEFAVLTSRFEKIEQENRQLKNQLSQSMPTTQAGFSTEIANNGFIEDSTSKIQELLEITSIHETISGDFTQQLASYLTKVDNLSQRLTQAKSEMATVAMPADYNGAVTKNAR